MKKIVLLMIIFFSSALAGNCFYLKTTDNAVNESWYAKFKGKDFASGNVYMQNINNREECNGFWFYSSNKTETKFDKTGVFAKIYCTNGKLFEIKLKQDFTGEGIDQYKNKYSFTKIKKKEYRKHIMKKKKIKNAKAL